MRVSAKQIPTWLKIGARVKMVGNWRRVRLQKGALGTVCKVVLADDGSLIWFYVEWDGLDNYSNGVAHFGWHSTEGVVVPAEG